MKYQQPIGGAANDPYVDGNPGAGIAGSPVPAKAIEHPQRELAYVITQAGITPNEAVLTQVHAAILALIAANAPTTPDATTAVKGKVMLADNTTALAGSDTTKAVTSAGLASSKNLAANGYMKLPGGLVIQWGTANTTSGSVAVTWPIAFTTFYAAAGIDIANAASGAATNLLAIDVGASATGATFWAITQAAAAVSSPFYYIAIGKI